VLPGDMDSILIKSAREAQRAGQQLEILCRPQENWISSQLGGRLERLQFETIRITAVGHSDVKGVLWRTQLSVTGRY